MIVVQVSGGIGNQMFQIAYAKRLQMQGYKVCLDIETAFEQEKLVYRIDKPCTEDFNIDLPCLNSKRNIYRCIIGRHKNVYLTSVINKMGFYHYYDWTSPEYASAYMRGMIQVKDHSYIKGYFQSEKFFKRYEHEIRKVFMPKKEVTLPRELEAKRNKSLPLVGIHIRRGDYKGWKELLIEPQYYVRAIAYLKEKIGSFDICIFSDECDWIKDNWKVEGYNVFYANEYNKDKDYCDMIWMSQCDHNIIANSTFSWWGAWLNSNKDKVVIAPKIWIKGQKRDNMIPESWVKL